MQLAQYAMLLFCITFKSRALCFVRLLEQMDFNGEDVLNDYDCPLLTLTSNIVTIPSCKVEASVSIIHQCTSSCTFVLSPVGQIVERENVSNAGSLTYKHDGTNTLYCLNVYCMHQ